MLTLLRTVLTLTGLVLSIDCLVLMANGMINFGTVVPFVIGVIFLAHGLLWRQTRQLFSESIWLNRLWHGLWAVFVIWLSSFVVFAWSLQTQIKQAQSTTPSVKAILILGAGTRNNQPSPTLAKRLDAAMPLIKAQPNALIVTSGGIGFRDRLSSGQIMANYLNKTHNVPLAGIIVEGDSTSTEENFSLSLPLLANHGFTLADPIAVVTSDFHILRSKAIATHQGFEKPIMIASSTPLSIRYNAWFREYFAFVSGWLLNEY